MKLSKKALKKIALMVTMGLFAASNVYALPSQGTLDNSAAATISADAANGVMNIAGKGQNNIINWASFNIDKGEIVKFNDKNNYLNLVHGVDMSRIYGTISGGNAVYLVNPNGILFAEGAALDNVGGFVASTRNISSINKEAFLNDPYNTTAVLGVDNPVMDNKDYYPEGSKYVPKITMADIQLTNVPDSATLILDGPGGVILKNRDLLNDKITHVITRQIGGELGLGYGPIYEYSGLADLKLTDNEKNKISLINGDKYYGKESTIPYPVKWYRLAREWTDLKYTNKDEYTMLANDIDGSWGWGVIEAYNGVLEGLGYSINNLSLKNNYYSENYINDRYHGLFGRVGFTSSENEIRNLNIENAIINAEGSNIEAGVVTGAAFGGILFNNVNVNGIINVDSSKYTDGSLYVGGLIGNATSAGNFEIRNSTSDVKITVNGKTGDIIGGVIGKTFGTGTVNMYNVINDGDIGYNQIGSLASSDGIPVTSIAGIIGNSDSASIRILDCENLGDIAVTYSNSNNKEEYVVSGITNQVVYPLKDTPLIIGDTYNFGKISFKGTPGNITGNTSIYTGGIVSLNRFWPHYGDITNNIDKNVALVSDITNKELTSYYIKNNISSDKTVYMSNFGEGRTWKDPNPSNIQDDLIHHLHEMVGLHDFSTKHELPKPPTPDPNPNPNPNPDDGNTGSGTTNPPSGGNTGSGTTNPPSGGNTGSGTTNPPSGGNTGSGTTNPPSGGNTGSGTTNPPSGGNTGSGTTNPPSGGSTGSGTTNPPSGDNAGSIKDPTSNDTERKGVIATIVDWFNDIREKHEVEKLEKERLKNLEKLEKAQREAENALKKAVEDFKSGLTSNSTPTNDEVEKTIKTQLKYQGLDKNIDNDTVKDAIAKIFGKAVQDSIKTSGETGFDINSLWSRLSSSYDESFFDEDNKYYKIDSSFIGESGALLGTFTVTVGGKKHIVSASYSDPALNELTFKSAVKKYGQKQVDAVINACIADTTKLANAMTDQNVAVKLWKECGGNTMAGKAAQGNIKGIIMAIVPNAEDLIANIISTRL